MGNVFYKKNLKRIITREGGHPLISCGTQKTGYGNILTISTGDIGYTKKVFLGIMNILFIIFVFLKIEIYLNN